MTIYDTREGTRLVLNHQKKEHWNRWGPFLSERAWGTVREDYSPNGEAWSYFPHDHARSRAYRWNEDGIAGICDRHQYLCFALGLWNGADSFLKERMFGLTGHRGNHAACFDNKVELISKCQTQNDNGDDCRSQGGHQQVLPKLDVSSSKTKMEPLIGALNATARPAPAPAASTSFASSRLFSKKRETAQG